MNAAALLVYAGEPFNLLETLQGIEAAEGRDRARQQRWGPRTLDLDILWVEGLAMESDRLTIPHPRLTDRPFALRPLVDVLPDAIDPNLAVTLHAHVRRADRAHAPHEAQSRRPVVSGGKSSSSVLAASGASGPLAPEVICLDPRARG